MKWYIGCSGFYYKNWKPVFYPPGISQNKWFEFYSSKFNSLESNVTFYRFPELELLKNWHESSPTAFRFAVKAPRLITHYKQFRGCEKLLEDFYNTLALGLKDKLGPVLFQFPPSLQYSAEILDRILKNLRKEFRNALEFRHASWWNEEVWNILRKEKTIFTGTSHPSLPKEAIATEQTAYYRFHGVPRLYYSSYKNEFLKKIADNIARNKSVREVYIYFNNTATTAALENASWMREYISRQIQ